MTTYVVDASVVIKWVVEEDGTHDALELRRRATLIAPDLLFGECANILWKKVRADNLEREAALLAAKALQRVDVELVSMRALMSLATAISVDLDHPACDCAYLALASERASQLVTADDRLVEKIRRSPAAKFRHMLLTVSEAVEQLRSRS